MFRRRPAPSSLYWPEGMKKATNQTIIRTRVRIVIGAGNPRFRFSPDGSADALFPLREPF